MGRFRAIFVVTSLSLLASCGSLSDLLRPAPEGGMDTSEAYLRGGPNTQIEMGADEETMLERYSALQRARTELDDLLKEEKAFNEQLSTRMAQTEEELDEERRMRVAAEQEMERLSQRARDLEAKVLSMSIDRAKLEQELLLLRISSLQRELDDMNAATAAADAVSPGPLGGR